MELNNSLASSLRSSNFGKIAFFLALFFIVGLVPLSFVFWFLPILPVYVTSYLLFVVLAGVALWMNPKDRWAVGTLVISALAFAALFHIFGDRLITAILHMVRGNFDGASTAL